MKKKEDVANVRLKENVEKFLKENIEEVKLKRSCRDE